MKSIQFSDLDQWQEIFEFRYGPPPPSGHPDLGAWIHALHVPGPHDQPVEAGFDRLIRQHVGGNEQWLGISGPSHVGKSTAVTHVLLQRAMAERDRWRARMPGGGLFTPFIYVVATSQQGAAGLLSAIAEAAGLPYEGTEKTLKAMLSVVLVELGTLLIVADESQMYRRSTDNASKISDGLRSAIHLPVPIAFVGVDLEHSALLRRSTRNNDTVDQLARRHFPLPLRPVRTEKPHAIYNLIRGFEQGVSRVDDLDLGRVLTDPDLLGFLANSSEGRPGSLLNVLKCSAVEALALNNGRLTRDLVIAEADKNELLYRRNSE